MNQRLIAEIGKSQRLRIVYQLKRTRGMSVGELSEVLGLSYMGIKQYCVELEKSGYLDTFRRPNAAHRIGRPELVYRLTPKSRELFPSASNPLTLELLRSAEVLYGPAAPEKLLYLTFQRHAQECAARISGGTLAARAAAFARLREEEGCMAGLEGDAQEGYRIVEHHSPVADLLEAYPALVARLEGELFSRVLGVPVHREQVSDSGLYTATFSFAEPA